MPLEPLPAYVTSKDFVLSPVQGAVLQDIPRLIEFGPVTALPPNDPVESRRFSPGVSSVVTALTTPPPQDATGPLPPHHVGTTLLDFLSISLFSHMVGMAVGSELVSEGVEAALEIRHGMTDHTVPDTVDPLALFDPNLALLPGGNVMEHLGTPLTRSPPSLSQLGQRLDKMPPTSRSSRAPSMQTFGKPQRLPLGTLKR